MNRTQKQNVLGQCSHLSPLRQETYFHISHFSWSCVKVAKNSNLKREGFTLAHSLGKLCQWEQVLLVTWSPQQGREMDSGAQFFWFSPGLQPIEWYHTWVGFPTSVNRIWKSFTDKPRDLCSWRLNVLPNWQCYPQTSKDSSCDVCPSFFPVG